MFIILFTTLPVLPSGDSEIVMQNSYIVVLISRFDPTIVDKIIFDEKTIYSGFLDIVFYRVPCSEIETESQIHYQKGQLFITNNMLYGINNALYLIEGSELHYTFSVSDSQTVSSCVATIYIYNSHSAYSEFFATRQVTQVYKSYCLYSNDTLNFTLSTPQSNQYFYVVVEGFESVQLNYTVTGDILEYNTANLPITMCTFHILSSSECSVSLADYSDSQDVCILASVQRFNFGIILNYFVESHKHTMQYIAAWVILGLTILCFFCCCSVGVILCNN